MSGTEAWAPAQQRVADELLGIGQPRPIANLAWAIDVAESIDAALEGVVSHTADRPLWIGKGTVSGVLACEAGYVAREAFEWSTKTARGEIIHRAIAMTAAGSASEPRDLAWAAVEQAQREGGRSIGSWLRGLTETERLALVIEALPGIDGFLTSWPPLLAAWHPVPEYPLGATLAGGRVKTSGRVDLALGNPRMDSDGFLRRRKVLIELKSGRPNLDHRAEHLFYGLLECLKSGIAPFRVATYYLDDNSWILDEITEELLRVAADRLVAAVRRLVELGEGRTPRTQVGWRCGFCTLVETCPQRLGKRDQA